MSYLPSSRLYERDADPKPAPVQAVAETPVVPPAAPQPEPRHVAVEVPAAVVPPVVPSSGKMPPLSAPLPVSAPTAPVAPPMPQFVPSAPAAKEWLVAPPSMLPEEHHRPRPAETVTTPASKSGPKSARSARPD